MAILTYIEKWLDYCNGTDYDTSEFYTLLMEVSESDLEEILVPLPYKEEMAPRLKSLLKIEKLFPSNLEEVKNYILSDLRFKKNILRKIQEDELVGKIEKAEKYFTFVDCKEFSKFKQSEVSLESEIIGILGQEFIFDIPQSNKRITRALTEAIYGVTSNYNMVWYILAPLAGEYFCNANQYIELWNRAVDFFVTSDSEIIVYAKGLG